MGIPPTPGEFIAPLLLSYVKEHYPEIELRFIEGFSRVVPGQLHTPMVEERLAGQRAGGNVDALLAQRLARIPLGFMGDGRDTANAALFLASDEARFITGTEIVVDGGMIARCD